MNDEEYKLFPKLSKIFGSLTVRITIRESRDQKVLSI